MVSGFILILINKFSFQNLEKTLCYSIASSIFIYSQYSQVVFENGKFKIKTDDDLKFVLCGIEQRFYTTPIGGEKRIANSIISI